MTDTGKHIIKEEYGHANKTSLYSYKGES